MNTSFVEIVYGPYSVLPYAGYTDVRFRRLRRRARMARPWFSAMVLLGAGVWMAQFAAARMPVMHRTSTLSPVVVTAPRPSRPFLLRRDSVLHMLTKKHVDSATAARWAHEFVFYGEQTNVNPKLLVAVAYAESEFNPRAYSRAGAIGLMQVVPSRTSWSEYEPRCGQMTSQSLHEPRVNICFGAHILREFLTRHHEDTDHALAAYNNGSGELNGYPDRVYASLAALRH